MMNKYFFILIILPFLGFSQSFNYQAVVRASTGDVVINQNIGVELSILQGGPTGTNVYTETHSVTSNAYGVISLFIGSGTTTGNFTTIDWSTQDYWLDIAVDITGGTTYVTMGTSKFQHVPYSSYANTSGDKAFSTTANVTSNAPGDITMDNFVLGSTQLDDITTSTDDNSRMFFNKTKGAFRAGTLGDSDNTTLDFWDDSKVGQFSTAFGGNVEASGYSSIAIGYGGRATAPHAVALGDYSTSSGNSSLTAGQWTTAEAHAQTTIGANSTRQTAFSTGSHNANDRVFVIGNGPNSGTLSDALVMLKSGNTTLNGELTIDADNTGGNSGYTLPPQDGTANQVISTDGAGTTSWTTLTDNVNDADADPTNEIELPTQTGHSGKLLTTNGTDPSWTSDITTTSITTDALTVSNLPAFAADLSGTAAITDTNAYVGLGGWRTSDASFPQNLFDNGNHFDETNGEFTAPVNGFYYFTAQIRFDAIQTGYVRLSFAVNGTTGLQNGMHAIAEVQEAAETIDFQTLNIGGVMKLNANDKVSVVVYSVNDSDWSIQSESGFSGYLISRF